VEQALFSVYRTATVMGRFYWRETGDISIG
jgi:hypothetical protein